MVEVQTCFHCQGDLAGSSHRVTLRADREEVSLPLCHPCQDLRREGQLPVELLLQQWHYGAGHREPVEDLFADFQVALACLGCGAALAALSTVNPGASALVLARSRRMPDGSVMMPCPQCQRTNVLEGRAGQLVAVRLW